MSLSKEQKAQLAQQKTSRVAPPSAAPVDPAEDERKRLSMERKEREEKERKAREEEEARAAVEMEKERQRRKDQENEDFIRRKLAEAAEKEAENEREKQKAAEPDFLKIMQSEIPLDTPDALAPEPEAAPEEGNGVPGSRITDADLIVIGKSGADESVEKDHAGNSSAGNPAADSKDDNDDESEEVDEEERAAYMAELERIRRIQEDAIREAATGATKEANAPVEVDEPGAGKDEVTAAKGVPDAAAIPQVSLIESTIDSGESQDDEDDAEAIRREAERIRLASMTGSDIDALSQDKDAESSQIESLEERIRQKEEKLRLAKLKKQEEQQRRAEQEAAAERKRKEAEKLAQAEEEKAKRIEKLLAEKERLRREREELQRKEEEERAAAKAREEAERAEREQRKAQEEAERQARLAALEKEEEERIRQMEEEIVREKQAALEKERAEREEQRAREQKEAEEKRRAAEELRLAEEKKREEQARIEAERERKEREDQEQVRRLEKQRSQALLKAEGDLEARRSRRANSQAENAKAPQFAPVQSKRPGFLSVRLCEECGAEGGVSEHCASCGGDIVEVEVPERALNDGKAKDDEDDGKRGAVLRVCVDCGEEGGDEFCELCGGDLCELDGNDLDDTMVMSPQGTVSLDFALIEQEKIALRGSNRPKALFEEEKKELKVRDYNPTEKDVFIVELSTDVVRFGWSSDAQPTLYLLPPKSSPFNSRNLDYVTDNDALEDLLKSVFRAASFKKRNPVLFMSSLPTICDGNSNLLDLLNDEEGLVTTKVPSLFSFGTSPVFAAFRSDTVHPTALVIHLDYSNLSIVPVYYGHSMHYARRRVDFGMSDVLQYVALLSGVSFAKNVDALRSISSQLKVAADFEADMGKRGYERTEADDKQAIRGWICKDPQKDVKTDFGPLRLGVASVAAAQLLLEPRLWFDSSLPEALDKMVAAVLSETSSVPQLAANVILSGFAGEIKGLKEVLMQRVPGVKVSSVPPGSAWMGGKYLALHKDFKRYCCTPEEAELTWFKYRFTQ